MPAPLLKLDVFCLREPVSIEWTDVEEFVEATLTGGGSLTTLWGAMSFFHEDDVPFNIKECSGSYSGVAWDVGWSDIWNTAERDSSAIPIRKPIAAPTAPWVLRAPPAPPCGALTDAVLDEDHEYLKLLGYAEEEVEATMKAPHGGSRKGKGGETAAWARFNAFVQKDAEPEKKPPNLPLGAVLANSPPHEECLRFALLRDLHPDPHYGFKIKYGGKDEGDVRAACAVILIESTQKTKTSPCGEGFKMVTMGVKDAAAKDPSAKTYTIVGYGSMDGLVKLDPPRGKMSRFAVVVVNQVEDTTIQMETAEFIEQDEAAEAIECFKRLRELCRQILPRGTQKRSHSMIDDFNVSPNSLKKCKTLSAMPSDASLPNGDEDNDTASVGGA